MRTLDGEIIASYPLILLATPPYTLSLSEALYLGLGF